jgi:hypothetical protein
MCGDVESAAMSRVLGYQKYLPGAGIEAPDTGGPFVRVTTPWATPSASTPSKPPNQPRPPTRRPPRAAGTLPRASRSPLTFYFRTKGESLGLDGIGGHQVATTDQEAVVRATRNGRRDGVPVQR